MKLKFFACGIFLLILLSCHSKKTFDYFEERSFFDKSVIQENVVPYFYYGDKGMWKHLFDSSAPFVLPEIPAKSIIIPHHDITVAQQNSFYKGLSASMNPQTVVLICPDHYEAGNNYFAVPDEIVFDSIDRKIELDNDLIGELKNSSLGKYIQVNNELWFKEHGAFVHTPFIGHYFKNAKFLPIAVKPECVWGEEAKKAFEELAVFLNDSLPENCLVIASVDFSHYQIPRMTDIHDLATMFTIANDESYDGIEVDSPETLSVVRRYSALRGCKKPVLIHRTSTYDYIPEDDVVSTSHQYWGFYPDGSKAVEEFNRKVRKTKQRYDGSDYGKQKNLTILVGGSGNPGFGIRDVIRWDRYNTSSDAGVINLKDGFGDEARFMRGFDSVIFDASSFDSDTGSRKEIFSGLYRIKEEEKHLTEYIVDLIDIEDFNLAAVDHIMKMKKADNCVSVLVITNENTEGIKANAKMLEAGKLTCFVNKFYDAVVLRDDTGTVDSFLYLDGKEPVNLGIAFSKKKKWIKGQLAALVWSGGQFRYETFEYKSKNGKLPRMYQNQIF